MEFWEPKSKSEEIAQRTPVWLDDSDIKCEIPDCLAHVFRGSRFCRTHFLERVNKETEQREREEQEAYKRMEKKDYPKIAAMNRFAIRNRYCSHCGVFGLHKAVPKHKDKMPKHPTCYEETLRILCQDCLKAGR
jgi:hypothetical protein